MILWGEEEDGKTWERVEKGWGIFWLSEQTKKKGWEDLGFRRWRGPCF